MLKKSLLAISLAAAVGTVNAGTLNAGGTVVAGTTNPQTISNQSGATVASLNTLTMTIGSTAAVRENYKTLDKVKVTVTGATLSASSNATISVSGLAGVTAVNPTYPDANTILFDVASASSTPAAGSTISIGGVALALTAGQNVSMTIEAISTVAGVVIDSASGAVLNFADEFAAKKGSNVANAVISFDRLTFSGPSGHSASADVIEVAITDAALTHSDVTAGGLATTVKLNGDFSFLDVDGDGTLEAGEGSITGAGGTLAVAKDLQSATITANSVGTKAFTVTLPAASKKVQVAAQTYTADATVAYTNAAGKAGSVVTSGIAVGSWTLDGTTEALQFMPFGSQYANSVTVTNTSAIAGDIMVTITGNGKTTTATKVGTAAAKSVTQVGKEIAALAAANGITEGYVSVTTNAANAKIVGIYYAKADGDRVLTK
jgi:hypothetical protein